MSSEYRYVDEVVVVPERMADVFANDYRYIAKFIEEHQGDVTALNILIADMADYRARSLAISMVSLYLEGEATVEARIAKEKGEIQ